MHKVGFAIYYGVYCVVNGVIYQLITSITITAAIWAHCFFFYNLKLYQGEI